MGVETLQTIGLLWIVASCIIIPRRPYGVSLKWTASSSKLLTTESGNQTGHVFFQVSASETSLNGG